MACKARLGLKQIVHCREEINRLVRMACKARLGLKHFTAPIALEVHVKSEWPAKPAWD